MQEQDNLELDMLTRKPDQTLFQTKLALSRSKTKDFWTR